MPREGDPAPELRGRPISGLPVDLGELLRGGPVVVAFLRPPGSRSATRAVARLDPLVDLLVGGGVIAVTRGDLAAARDWVPRIHARFPVVLDADGSIFAAWGVGRDWKWRALAAAMTPAGRRLAATLRPGQAPLRGEDDQAPAEFAIRADGTIARAEIGRDAGHLPSIAALARALGVAP